MTWAGKRSLFTSMPLHLGAAGTAALHRLGKGAFMVFPKGLRPAPRQWWASGVPLVFVYQNTRFVYVKMQPMCIEPFRKEPPNQIASPNKVHASHLSTAHCLPAGPHAWRSPAAQWQDCMAKLREHPHSASISCAAELFPTRSCPLGSRSGPPCLNPSPPQASDPITLTISH